jgi:hypothetical protein
MSSLGENQQRTGDSVPGEQLRRGQAPVGITNRLVVMMREDYGRGPIKAKSYVLDNMIVFVFNSGLRLSAPPRKYDHIRAAPGRRLAASSDLDVAGPHLRSCVLASHRQ